MTEDEDIDLDFRPFFDLAMGVLFMLLILLASQFLVARVSATAEADAAAAQRHIEARRQADRDIVALFEHARKLAAERNLSLEIDPAARRMALTPPTLDDRGFAAAAAFSADFLTCAAPPARPAARCPDIKAVRIDEAIFDGSAFPTPEAISLPGDARARMQGSIAFSQLLRLQPGLMELRAMNGSLLLRPGEPAISSGNLGTLHIGLVLRAP